MVDPYSPQQFFDQPANITNGQLLAMNPKFTQNVIKQLKKPVARKTNKGKDPIQVEQLEIPEAPMDINENEGGASNAFNPHEEEELLAQTKGYQNNTPDRKSTALYCQAYIKNKEIQLIVDSGSSSCIISLRLLKELDMEID